MIRVTVEYAQKLIEGTNGLIFTATFTKRNGSKRKMNCRVGVKRGIKGVGMAYDASEHDLISVFDVKKRAYRAVRLDTLTQIDFKGKQFKVIQ